MAKRRPAGDGMVRKREDGRWEGRIVIGHRENGEPLFRHVYAKTQKALLDKLHQNIECYRDVELTEDSRMTLGQWLDRWLTEYKAGTVRPGTLKGYRRYIEYYIKPQLGDKQISLLSQQDIQRMYRRLKTEGRIHEHPEMGHQLSDSMVRHIHTTLHAALKDAVQAHVIHRNPTEGYNGAQTQLQAQAHSDRRGAGRLSRGGGAGRDVAELLSDGADDRPAPRRDLRTAMERLRRGGRRAESVPYPPQPAEGRVHRRRDKNGKGNAHHHLAKDGGGHPAAAQGGYHQSMDIPRPSEAGGSCQPRLGLPPHENAAPTGGAAQHSLPRSASHLRHPRPHQRRGCQNAVRYPRPHQRLLHAGYLHPHATSDMQKQACGIVGGFMEDIFGKELKPWQESEKPVTER